jgi:hypothetical protein
MKISKQDRTLPHLGLLNFEGDAVRAYKKADGDNYIIVDDRMEIIAEWDSLEMFEFTRGDFTVTTSYGREYRYTDWNEDPKPKKEKLDLFIGIVDLPVVVNRITELLLSVKEEDLKRNSITTMRMVMERSMTPSIVVKYEDGTEIIHKEVSDIIQFLESLKDE